MSTGTILFIDDDQTLAIFVGTVLKNEGYKFTHVLSGLEGLDYLDSTIPDMIICDIMMPHMDGWDVLEKIKENSRLDDIPFVFLTSCNDREQYTRAKEAGVNLMLLKDMGASLVVAAVKSILDAKTKR